MTSLADAPIDGAAVDARRLRSSVWRTAGLAAVVAAAGFLMRIVPLLLGGGLHSYGRYDDGVYYTAAESLTFGRIPYRDFVFLHPPGLVLLLTPFAALGRLTSDPTGLAVGRVAFMAVGALNAVLIAMLAKRWSWIAAALSGLLYACWMPAIYGEQSTLLEPLATTAVLTALLLMVRPGVEELTRRAEILAGVALGIGVSIKIWYATPWLVIVLWQLIRRRFPSALRFIAGSVASAALIVVPFFVLAPRQMFRMVILDQLQRSSKATSPLSRLPDILGVRPLANGHHTEIMVATAIGIVVVVVASLVCLKDRAARVLVAVFATNLAVLLATPAFFLHYAEFTAAPLAVVLGIAVGKVRDFRLPARTVWVPALAMGAAILASAVSVVTTPQGRVFPGKAFAAAAPPGCVMSDDPTAMIEMNRLTTDLRSGCVVPVDVSGITYDRLRAVGPHGARVGRGRNLRWQRYLHDYLFSGTSFVILRRPADVIVAPYAGMIHRAAVLAEADGLALRGGHGTGPIRRDGVTAAPDSD